MRRFAQKEREFRNVAALCTAANGLRCYMLCGIYDVLDSTFVSVGGLYYLSMVVKVGGYINLSMKLSMVLEDVFSRIEKFHFFAVRREMSDHFQWTF
jgi:hypothetical protein